VLRSARSGGWLFLVSFLFFYRAFHLGFHVTTNWTWPKHVVNQFKTQTKLNNTISFPTPQVLFASPQNSKLFLPVLELEHSKIYFKFYNLNSKKFYLILYLIFLSRILYLILLDDIYIF
jgi:hypothetical protein